MGGATRLMSSRQWRGGGGSSSGAAVIFSSTPQLPHRYRRFTLRISPEGGGSGMGRASVRRMNRPSFMMTKNIATAMSSRITLRA